MMRRIALFLMCLLCMALFAADLWMALAFLRELDRNRIDAVAVPQPASSAEDFAIIALRRENFSDEDLEDMLKKLIREYITARYTITGSWFADSANLGILDKSQHGNIRLGALLKIPAVASRKPAAMESFAGLLNEAGEIAKLRAARTTRTVRITDGPRQYLDPGRWITDVELVIKTPLVWDISKAEREKYQIHMYVELISGIAEANPELPPSSAFRFAITSVEKFRQ
ncbi:MAG: hypothetical protein LBT92_00280 [Rickettsiales bacterium]|jgi:hypothetical protein|nr:hypothetical protein [Rickettsiales bacterium]